MNTESLKATRYTVGEWGGDEQAAADGFNRVVDALIGRYAEDESPMADDRLREAVHAAWDRLGSDDRLLRMTEREAAEIAADLL